jgi:hypothetical protein
MSSLLEDIHGSKKTRSEELQLIDKRQNAGTTNSNEAASNSGDDDGSVDKILFI